MPAHVDHLRSVFAQKHYELVDAHRDTPCWVDHHARSVSPPRRIDKHSLPDAGVRVADCFVRANRLHPVEGDSDIGIVDVEFRSGHQSASEGFTFVKLRKTEFRDRVCSVLCRLPHSGWYSAARFET